jgi:hypothetical protein
MSKWITIAQRFRPYSHIPGIFCLLPCSPFRLQIFPTRLIVHDLSQAEPKWIEELRWDLTGPLKDFMVQTDLEGRSILICGHAREGYVRFRLSSEADSKLVFLVEKAPPSGIHIYQSQGPSFSLSSKESFEMIKREIAWPAALNGTVERLALGSHRAQNWDLVPQRCDLAEIFPIWNLMGQLTPDLPLHDQGAVALLEEYHSILSANQPEKMEELFKKLFKAAFYGLLVPRLMDDQYQGIIPSCSVAETASPLVLLTEGRHSIRRLFIQETEEQIEILPVLPPQLHAGRYLNLQLKSAARLDMEWSKKTIRRMILSSEQDQTLLFSFKKVKSFRIRCGEKDPGQRVDNGLPLAFEKNCYYFFDNFA